MTDDARFEDATEAPLRLWANDAEGIRDLSALLQDAVFPITEMRWMPGERRFALLVNRFRWEDADNAERAGRGYERVQSLLSVENAQAVRTQGVDRQDRDQILSLLSLDWQAGDAPSGQLVLTLAGDGAIAVTVEAAEVVLRDVSRPYVAPSGARPRHPE